MKALWQHNRQPTTDNQLDNREVVRPTGGLAMRTDLWAGLAWDDLDDKAQELWGNLTNTLKRSS